MAFMIMFMYIIKYFFNLCLEIPRVLVRVIVFLINATKCTENMNH